MTSPEVNPTPVDTLNWEQAIADENFELAKQLAAECKTDTSVGTKPTSYISSTAELPTDTIFGPQSHPTQYP